MQELKPETLVCLMLTDLYIHLGQRLSKNRTNNNNKKQPLKLPKCVDLAT